MRKTGNGDAALSNISAEPILTRLKSNGVWACMSVPVVPKVALINWGLSSLVGGEFHKEVCLYMCVLCVEGDGRREGEKNRSESRAQFVSPSARYDTVAMPVSGKACVSWQ